MIMRELNPLPVSRNNGIQRTAPAASDDFDGIDGIRPAAHCPRNITDIVDVDVLIHHNDITTEISAALALARNPRCLARVPGIALLDRDNRQEATEVTRNTPSRPAPRLFLLDHECMRRAAVRSNVRLAPRYSGDAVIIGSLR